MKRSKKLELTFASPPVRNVATVGGNLAASSSSEDLIPIFLTLDARVSLKSASTERVIPLVEFIRGKRETSRTNNEILAEVSFNELKPNSWCTFEKIGRRERVIISLVSLACTLAIDRSSGKVGDVKLHSTELEARYLNVALETERILLGSDLNEFKLKEACEILENELSLTSDFRASAKYRTKLPRTFFENV